MSSYRTTLVDPPWMERGGGKSVRGAQRHYPLLPTPQILEVIASSPFDPDVNSHLYLWVTDNFLKDGLWLMENLGFTYKRTFQWVKVKGESKDLRYGIGQYARGAHETLLFGVRGSGKHPDVCTDRKDIPSVFFAPVEKNTDGVRIHSRKPQISYEVIEARSKGPYLELFARCQREGWSSWGNEIVQSEEML